LDLIQKTYDRTDLNFIASRDFSHLVDVCSGRITTDPSNKFVHIRHFISELKANKAKPVTRPLSHHNQLSPKGSEPETKKAKTADKTTTVCGRSCSAAVSNSINSISSNNSSASSTNIPYCSAAVPVPNASSYSAAVDSSSHTTSLGSPANPNTVEGNIESIEILGSDEEVEISSQPVEPERNSSPGLPKITSAGECSKSIEVMSECAVVSVQSVDNVPASTQEASNSNEGTVNARDLTKKAKASSTTNHASQNRIRRLEKLLVVRISFLYLPVFTFTLYNISIFVNCALSG